MATRRGSTPQDKLLYKLKPLKMQFLPFKSDDNDAGLTSIFEAVIPRDAPDGPDASFYGPDNLYHTGDLFERIEDDGYVYRGRANDWIKTNAGLIDTKYVDYSRFSASSHMFKGDGRRGSQDVSRDCS
jgi:hypothetical protein